MSEIIVQESDWQCLICPLETVKKWKNGYSIKCPETSSISWWSGPDLDDWILKSLQCKRRGMTCGECQKRLTVFLSLNKKEVR